MLSSHGWRSGTGVGTDGAEAPPEILRARKAGRQAGDGMVEGRLRRGTRIDWGSYKVSRTSVQWMIFHVVSPGAATVGPNRNSYWWTPLTARSFSPDR